MASNPGPSSNGGQHREGDKDKGISMQGFLEQFLLIQQGNARENEKNRKENSEIKQLTSTTLQKLVEGQAALQEQTRALGANAMSHDVRIRALEIQVAGQSRGNYPVPNWTPLTPAHEDQEDEARDYDDFVPPARKKFFKSNMTRIPGPTGPSSDRYVCPRCQKNYANSYILLHLNKGTCVERGVAE